MDNEKKAKDLANKHLKLQGVALPIRFSRRVHKAFLNAISEALNTDSVVKSFYCQTERCDKQCDECGLVELNNVKSFIKHY